MSFDLYFCAPPGAQIDNSRLHEHLKGLEHVTESRSNYGSLVQFEYSNPATGVYCLFTLRITSVIGQEEALVIPDGYVSLGLSASINFLRPKHAVCTGVDFRCQFHMDRCACPVSGTCLSYLDSGSPHLHMSLCLTLDKVTIVCEPSQYE